MDGEMGAVARVLQMSLAGLILAAASCAAQQRVQGFTRIEDYHLQEVEKWGGSSIDPMAEFERKHLLFGAVTQEDVRGRVGQYYTFIWKARPGPGPVTLRFDFRRTGTGEELHRIEQEVLEVRAKNRTTVRVIGDDYRAQGRVVAWRASLWRDGQELDSRRSFLWE